MSHIAPSDSEDPGPGSGTANDHYCKKSKYTIKSHDKKGHAASSSFPSNQSQATIDENLSEATGGLTLSKDKDKDELNHKKQVQKFENFDNNNPATTYGATAATGTSTDVQASRTGSRQIIYDRRREQEPLVFSRPRPPMQQQNQNRLPGDQNGGEGAVNAQPPPGDGDGGPQPRGGGWRAKCSKLCGHVRFASIFVVVLIFLAGIVSIVVWLTVINKQNTEPQVTYANLFEVIPIEDMLHPLTKGGADVKVNLTGRVDPSFEEANFHLSLYRGSCISPPNQTLTVNGRAENYQIFGENAFVSSHVIMLGSSAELNISFVLSNSTLMNGANFKVYFFKSYEDLMICKESEAAETRKNCPCYFSIPSGDTPSFSYTNGSYGDNILCENTEEKPFEGQYYFLTMFLGVNQALHGSPSIYDHLFVNFSIRYSTTGVFDPLATGFTGQKCNSLDDTNDKIYEYSCGVDYGSFFIAGRSMCTYLTFATPYITPELDLRFRDLFPVTITERHRDDIIVFITGVVLLAVLLILIAYCAPCRLILKLVRSRCAHRAYHALN